ncbi:PHP domain-containing protein [Candidatus Dependentiae bacterium]|nr:PHP domain-containing protein [Candidatus Dependentiae bacterium]
MKNHIIEKLKELITLKTLAGEDKFKIRAYENAVNFLETSENDIEELFKSGNLKNVKIMLSPDVHHKENFEYIKLGGGMARKGMLTKNDVVNTYEQA